MILTLSRSSRKRSNLATPKVTFSDFNRLGQPQIVDQEGIGIENLEYSETTGEIVERQYDGGHILMAGLGLTYKNSDAAGRPTGFDQIFAPSSTDTRSVGYSYGV